MDKIEFYNEQIEIEKQIIEAAEKSVKEVKNPLIKELIIAVAIDSKKHAQLLSALIQKESHPSPFIDEVQNKILADDIKKHIELEAKAIQTYKKYLEKLEDEKEKLIIKAIYQDEVRHHKLLLKIHKIIIQADTLSEEEIMDWIWQDAVSHGSPGG
ncbi:MAG: ferritin-like domain-containing protein [Candidatus Heimdallarchaeaceae archaeon]